jgi:hypothetical protein
MVAFFQSRTALALLAFLAVASFYQITEHTARVFGVLPYALLLLCPLLHLFMHGAHGAHGAHGSQEGHAGHARHAGRNAGSVSSPVGLSTPSTPSDHVSGNNHTGGRDAGRVASGRGAS